MPIIKSAKKRVKVAQKATSQNLRTKRLLKAAQKDLRLAMKSSNKKALTDAHRKNQSALDKTLKKRIIHKHKAARKQSQLAAQVKASSVKQTTVKKSATKSKVSTEK